LRVKKDDFHEKGANIRGKRGPFVVIFTDLDGTLLDHDTYEWESAKPSLKFCHQHKIPIIAVSSKTRAEIEFYQQKLGISAPFISESGGGIFFPKHRYPEGPAGAASEKNLWKWSSGPSYGVLVNALREIRDDLGWVIRGFSEMTPEEISTRTGLDLETSRLAASREYDEPFIIVEPMVRDMDALEKAAEKRGLKITIGGRFYHIHGKKDKGEAVKRVILWYKRSQPKLITIALGDSPTDFSMFEMVNHPVLVGSAAHTTDLADRIPGLKIMEETGPEGWNSAVLDILGKIFIGGIP
jgi:mannosyl-3-phosphoglycerate phosphatase